MSRMTTMLLMGVGGAGCAIARGVARSFCGDIRHVLIDTDAATADAEGLPFVLLGGERLAGHGAGGEIVNARLAAEDSLKTLDDHLAGVRLAIIVTALGGGTGSGATLEIVKHLASHGIVSVVFATTPFFFEGEARHRNARGVISMISDSANASFFIPLDKLVAGEDRMEAAMSRAVDTLADAVTLFWRLVETPGYIRLDVERIRRLVQSAGRGRFATVTMSGPNRCSAAVEALMDSPLLSEGTRDVKSIFCGVLAGDDLRLSEIGRIAEGLQTAFGTKSEFELATVNDEATFSGQLSVVALMFESSIKEEPESKKGGRRPKKPGRAVLVAGPQGRGRFNNSTPTIWHGEDLDIPTYLRQNISLEI